MVESAHLWAVGYDDMVGAEQLRDEIRRLAEQHCLILRDTAVVLRYLDGSVTLDGEPFVAITRNGRHTFASFLAGLALSAPPLTGAAAGALLRGVGTCALGDVGIDEEFISAVAALMKPGTSALFVLDEAGDMDPILQGLRGLGGTVLKANVDLKRVQLIQSTLATAGP